MKQIQGSVGVKINEYVHAWSEFPFVPLLVIAIFFPQINHFYYFTSLYALEKSLRSLERYRVEDW